MTSKINPPRKKQTSRQYPTIPERRYFTIGEVSQLCLLKTHVLRYWEQEFPQLRPAKRRGNRRYYQRKDIDLVRQIQTLLYDEGYTISGARLKLSGDLAKQGNQAEYQFVIRQTIAELEEILQQLNVNAEISDAGARQLNQDQVSSPSDIVEHV